MANRAKFNAETVDFRLLSAILASVRFRSSAFLDGRFSAPFGIVCPLKWDESAELAKFRHMSMLHVVLRGACDVDIPETGRSQRLSAGDVFVMPFPTAHTISSGAPSEFVRADSLIRPGPAERTGIIEYGGGGEEIRIVCGFIESSELLPTPLFRTLPSSFVIPTSLDPALCDITDVAGSIMDSVYNEGFVQYVDVLNRLMETLFVAGVQKFLSGEDGRSSRLSAALRDSLVSKILTVFHLDPARNWSVGQLAAEFGASKTTLETRFKATTGATVYTYLTRLRVQVACDLLRDTVETIQSIANHVGYKNEFSFARTFRNVTGVSPGQWRKSARSQRGYLEPLE